VIGPGISGGIQVKLAEIVWADGAQMVKLPEGFLLEGRAVSIRRQGDAVVLEPIKPATWPVGFFEQIHIADPAFVRPPQGDMPDAPRWD
jgi:virulence-associated protein VagC